MEGYKEKRMEASKKYRETEVYKKKKELYKRYLLFYFQSVVVISWEEWDRQHQRKE
jgi:hypothetical protein